MPTDSPRTSPTPDARDACPESWTVGRADRAGAQRCRPHPRAGELPVTSVSCRTCPSPWTSAAYAGGHADELDLASLEATADQLDALFELCLVEQLDDERLCVPRDPPPVCEAAVPVKSRPTSVARSSWAGPAMPWWPRGASGDGIDRLPRSVRPRSQPRRNTEALRQLDADRLAGGRARRVRQGVPGVDRDRPRLDDDALYGRAATERYLCGSTSVCTRLVHPPARRLALIGDRSAHNLARHAAHLGESQRAMELLRRARRPLARLTTFLMYLTHLDHGVAAHQPPCSRGDSHLRHGVRFWRLAGERTVLAHALGARQGVHVARCRTRLPSDTSITQQVVSLAEGDIDPGGRGTFSLLLRMTGRMAQAAQEAAVDIERARAAGSREWRTSPSRPGPTTRPQERPLSAQIPSAPHWPSTATPETLAGTSAGRSSASDGGPSTAQTSRRSIE